MKHTMCLGHLCLIVVTRTKTAPSCLGITKKTLHHLLHQARECTHTKGSSFKLCWYAFSISSAFSWLLAVSVNLNGLGATLKPIS